MDESNESVNFKTRYLDDGRVAVYSVTDKIIYLTFFDSLFETQ